LEIRECFGRYVGVLDDCYSKLASLLLANLLIEIDADIHRKIGEAKKTDDSLLACIAGECGVYKHESR